jgi:hypothetical protein
MIRKKNKKVIELNKITKVEFTEIDIVITQEDSMVIVDHDEILRICEMILTDKKLIN